MASAAGDVRCRALAWRLTCSGRTEELSLICSHDLGCVNWQLRSGQSGHYHYYLLGGLEVRAAREGPENRRPALSGLQGPCAHGREEYAQCVRQIVSNRPPGIIGLTQGQVRCDELLAARRLQQLRWSRPPSGVRPSAGWRSQEKKGVGGKHLGPQAGHCHLPESEGPRCLLPGSSRNNTANN